MPAVETNRRKVISRLLREGWTLLRHGREHDVYRHDQKHGIIIVPRHATLSPGVARSIAKAAGWN
jgi:predicted RNA binding protein YcfA (HicA-like mRNA interferase family)